MSDGCSDTSLDDDADRRSASFLIGVGAVGMGVCGWSCGGISAAVANATVGIYVVGFVSRSLIGVRRRFRTRARFPAAILNLLFLGAAFVVAHESYWLGNMAHCHVLKYAAQRKLGIFLGQDEEVRKAVVKFLEGKRLEDAEKAPAQSGFKAIAAFAWCLGANHGPVSWLRSAENRVAGDLFKATDDEIRSNRKVDGQPKADDEVPAIVRLERQMNAALALASFREWETHDYEHSIVVRFAKWLSKDQMANENAHP